MTPEQIQNWIDLDKLFAALPEEQFEMLQICRERSCGTVGCIAGWAVTLPNLVAAGFAQNLRKNRIELDGGHVLFNGPELASQFGILHFQWVELTTNWLLKNPAQARQAFRTLCPSLPPL